MHKRDAVVALVALSAVPVAFAQRASRPARIGWLSFSSPVSPNPYLDAFVQGLRTLGYEEGQNLSIERRYAHGRPERLAEVAAELVQLKVDAIVAAGTAATSAAQKATTTIPIVMGTANDPVGSGFVKSLGRPGGNITGVSNLTGDVVPKHLELLLQVVPGISIVAVLSNPANAAHAGIVRSVELVAPSVGVHRVVRAEVRNAEEIASAFSMFAREGVRAVIVVVDATFVQHRLQIAELAAKMKLLSISSFHEFAEAGGLMSYGQNLADDFRHAAIYVDKILKGAKPADLPVEQPTRFELVINLKTAKAIGITIPPAVRLRAEEVIR